MVKKYDDITVLIDSQGDLTNGDATIIQENLLDHLSELYHEYYERIAKLNESRGKHKFCRVKVGEVKEGSSEHGYYKSWETYWSRMQRKHVRKIKKLHYKIALVKSLVVSMRPEGEEQEESQ